MRRDGDGGARLRRYRGVAGSLHRRLHPCRRRHPPEGTADTAQIRLDVTPDGARLALEDLGFSAASDVTTGRYDVEDTHLSLVADLAKDGQTVGWVELEIDCGG
jgi:hypothetical protein